MPSAGLTFSSAADEYGRMSEIPISTRTVTSVRSLYLHCGNINMHTNAAYFGPTSIVQGVWRGGVLVPMQAVTNVWQVSAKGQTITIYTATCAWQVPATEQFIISS